MTNETPSTDRRVRMVLITGLSGSGKSSVAKCFEDLGYYCLDNLPVALLRPVLEDPARYVEGAQRIAVVADIRAPHMASSLPAMIRGIDRSRLDPFLLFLDTTDEVLIRRYSETRRRHPLGADGSVLEAIERERSQLQDLRGLADLVLDTTELTIHDIRARVFREFSPERFARSQLTISLVSFGFKRGIPYGSDMIFDLRFLPNPYFHDELRDQSGLDRPVLDFLEQETDFQEVASRLGDLLDYVLPRFVAEHRSYLTIGIGCTGGRHRSVAMVERLARRLQGSDWTIRKLHRDIARESAGGPGPGPTEPEMVELPQ
ncbi:MAG TPA: RNase adapter RapZ [Thermoanaerobaculia bacterium]|nr:RNase adapter RapZ [Thermoanaerobaculia bacterium]